MVALHPVWNPPVFQGKGKRKGYFEGWYHKHVPTAGGDSIAVIGGIAYDDQRRGEAFIQFIHGSRTEYIAYPVEDFRWENGRYQVYIGPNRFSADGLYLHIDRPGIQVSADLSYSSITPLQQRKLFSPGIMGWYRFVPRMECYHGVVSLDHEVYGNFQIDDNSINLTGGRGYIEKDWGSSMPESWVWFQTNSFADTSHSVMFSVARIPWMRGSFPGFLAICHTPQGQFRFTTYNGSQIVRARIADNRIEITFRSREHELQITASGSSTGGLRAPALGAMQRTIGESLDAQAQVRLTTIDGFVLFEGRANPAGLEIVGEAAALLQDATMP
ncbi:tocopherol cyclase family protein [Spirochaeta africana]|uniref:Tocopherol cyclase n=1 Tax=Spirochaeta africana (strain ATCC 700263 / DSM 8902 / Z-7692) TaxID=889378 RepID=H9ULW0_SPIAZ|nr:tocopherol cyclase family protein [Spirochaeta africana]AFG38503.1 hypothetical protein Spiaf_2472 [Spirochaeta africana DSM 8902]